MHYFVGANCVRPICCNWVVGRFGRTQFAPTVWCIMILVNCRVISHKKGDSARASFIYAVNFTL